MSDSQRRAGRLPQSRQATQPSGRPDPDERHGPLRIVLLVKINSGGMWILPQVAELQRRGHTVIAVLPAGAGQLTAALRAQRVQVIDFPWDFSFRPRVSTVRGLLRLRALIRSLRPDVLKYHLYASALAARTSSIGLPLRRIHVVAGPLFLESPIIRPVERLLWRMDSVTICGTEFTAARYGELGCPAHRRPVVTAGVDTDRFSPDADVGARAKARAELGIPTDRFVVVMVAYVYPPKRLVHRGRGIKGHDVLLAAWRTFHARHPRAHLLLVGGGWGIHGASHRAGLIRQFGIDDDPAITWLGSVPDVRAAYNAADVSVSPSLSEGHGAALEAGAMGVPSIVSDAGGLPETVCERSGWLVPRGDAYLLAMALTDAYREHRTGRLAQRSTLVRQRMVDSFDVRRSASLIADLIEQSSRRDVTRPDRPRQTADRPASQAADLAVSPAADLRASQPADQTETRGEPIAEHSDRWVRP